MFVEVFEKSKFSCAPQHTMITLKYYLLRVLCVRVFLIDTIATSIWRLFAFHASQQHLYRDSFRPLNCTADYGFKLGHERQKVRNYSMRMRAAGIRNCSIIHLSVFVRTTRVTTILLDDPTPSVEFCDDQS